MLVVVVVAVLLLGVLYGTLRIILGLFLPKETMRSFDAVAGKTFDVIGKTSIVVLGLGIVSFVIYAATR